jgi:asparagine synthase (glutamine-hydrolysing)
MSAIAGILNLNQDPINPEHIEGLMNPFQEFPADKVDGWTKDNLFFGCHAQWITPESVGEQLPFYDRGLVITADAIIDNREELFAKLQIDKSLLSTLPDSQLILLAYSKWEEEVPKHLIGDFAFMIWDEKKHKLFGARDFSGTRTLYFHKNDSTFAFSTLMESLLRLPYIEKKINEGWLAEFLAIPGMVESVDQVSTVYKNVLQVPPSHCITVENSRVKLARYCKVSEVPRIKFKKNEEYEEAFRELFQKAVKTRIRTYGEVGAQLSGGLDSGTVVSFASRELLKKNKKLKTFSYIPMDDFDDWTPKYFIPDERPYIKETINYVQNIDDNYLNFQDVNPFSEVDDMLSIMEMPYKFFENSYWLKGINIAAQQKKIKILLNGSRGNFSISWGSRNLTLNHYASQFRKLQWLKLYKELGLYCANFNTGKSIVLPQIIKMAIPLYNASKNNYQFPNMISPLLAEKTGVYEKLKAYGENLTGSVNIEGHIRKMHFDQVYFWNKSGVATTKLSLKYGLWERDPTNDLRVIQFCLGIPEDQFTMEGLERSLIRRATKGYLPDVVRLNQHSRGLQGADTIQRLMPVWPKILSELHEIISDSLMSEFLNINEIKKALEEIGSHPMPNSIFSDQFRVLTRSLIVHRFIKNTI